MKKIMLLVASLFIYAGASASKVEKIQFANSGDFSLGLMAGIPPYVGDMPFISIDQLVTQTRSYEIYKKMTTIGSSEENDIVCENAGLEPTHAIIYLDNNGFEIEPASRKAEICVNGKRVKKRTPFGSQETLNIGPLNARFSLFAPCSVFFSRVQNKKWCCQVRRAPWQDLFVLRLYAPKPLQFGNLSFFLCYP